MLPTRQLRGTTSTLAYLVLLRAEIARFTPKGLPCGTPVGLVSVALILTSRWAAVSCCAVLCSPDVPPVPGFPYGTSGGLACFTGRIIAQTQRRPPSPAQSAPGTCATVWCRSPPCASCTTPGTAGGCRHTDHAVCQVAAATCNASLKWKVRAGENTTGLWWQVVHAFIEAGFASNMKESFQSLTRADTVALEALLRDTVLQYSKE